MYRIDSCVVPPAVHATRAMPARAVCMYCRWGYTRVSTVHMQVSSVVPPAVHATRAMPARAVCVLQVGLYSGQYGNRICDVNMLCLAPSISYDILQILKTFI